MSCARLSLRSIGRTEFTRKAKDQFFACSSDCLDVIKSMFGYEVEYSLHQNLRNGCA